MRPGASNEKTLVILSLPFQRLIRSHLSPMVLNALTQRADVVVVSPFAGHPEFASQYSGEGIRHVPTTTLERLPWLARRLAIVSNFLRTRGYRRRNREQLPSYWAGRHVEYGENGNDTLPAFPKRLVMDVLAWIGSWPRAWTLLDSLIGSRGFNMPQLAAIASGYDRVTLIQAASWGFQDQALAWMGRRHSWRTVFLPYMTDQLFCNGYLYSDFDMVCVQGPTERGFAKTLQRVTDEKICNLGSLNFFCSRTVLRAGLNHPSGRDGVKRLLFVGSTAIYFPTASEFDCLDRLLQAVYAGEFGDALVTYRPIGHHPEIIRQIEQRFAGKPRLEINYASPAVYGLEKYAPVDWSKSITEFLESIAGFDVAVTAGPISLALDLALFGTPTIFYRGDATGILRRRRARWRLNNDKVTCWSEIPIVESDVDLLATIHRFLDTPAEGARVAAAVLAAWDYNPPDILQRLEKAVFNDASHGSPGR